MAHTGQYSTWNPWTFPREASLQNGGPVLIERAGNWLSTVDLRDAYLSVAIAEEHKKFLRFVWHRESGQVSFVPRPKDKTDLDNGELQDDADKRVPFSTWVSQVAWDAVSHSSCSLTSPQLLPAAAMSGNPVTQMVDFARRPGDYGSQCKGGPGIVDSSPQWLEWEEYSSRHDIRDRCFQVEVGCHLQKGQNRRFIVSTGEWTAH